MSDIHYIQIHQLCAHYEVEVAFFDSLNDYGLIELITIEEQPCIPEESLHDLEKMLRLHRELDINFEGIDTIFHLLNRIETLQEELEAVKGRLGLYE
ncbi:MAG: chaperone modulator CbpM [Crocinitomicaceae bacterium]